MIPPPASPRSLNRGVSQKLEEHIFNCVFRKQVVRMIPSPVCSAIFIPRALFSKEVRAHTGDAKNRALTKQVMG